MIEARKAFSQAYGADSLQAELMLPDSIADRQNADLWGVDVDGQLMSIVVTSDVDEATVIWSMATPPQFQRLGYGRRLLDWVLARKRETGTRDFLLFASTAGGPLYRSLGFEVLEHWQEWSRPRWVFGRT